MRRMAESLVADKKWLERQVINIWNTDRQGAIK